MTLKIGMAEKTPYLLIWLLTQMKVVTCDPGKNFVITLPQTFEGASLDTGLYITTFGSDGADVTLTTLPSAPAALNKLFGVPPGGNVVLPLTNLSYLLPTGTLISDMTIRLAATAPVVVVVKNKRGSNGDTFSPMPVDSLGRDHFVLAYNSTMGVSASFVTVTAPYDDTEVNVTFPSQSPLDAALSFVLNDVIYTYKDVVVVRLRLLQSLQIQAPLDLTGTRVVSSKPVAVLSGSNRTQIFKGACASHLLEQMPPTGSWGKTFLLIPVPNQRAGDLYRFVAMEPLTTVTLGTGKQIRLQFPGDFGEHLLSPGNFVYARADKPVLVGHYATEQDFYPLPNGTLTKDDGDPGLSVLTPVEQASDFYRFTFNTNYKDATHLYVVFTVKANLSSQLVLNEKEVGLWANVTWLNVTGDGGGYVAGYVDVRPSQLPFSLGALGGPVFNAFVHYVTSCESCSLSLTHGSSKNTTPAVYPCPASSNVPGDGVDNDCDGKIDEEPCCINSDPKDADGDSLRNEDCRGIGGSMCCTNHGATYRCQELQKSAVIYELSGRRRRAETVSKVVARTKLSCVVACMVAPGCWGTNFDLTAREGHWCELLFGHRLGAVVANGWSFPPLSPTAVYGPF